MNELPSQPEQKPPPEIKRADSLWPMSPRQALIGGAIGATLAAAVLGERWWWAVPLVFVAIGLPILMVIRRFR
jgi:hypothetical protein